jgi:hypothetical protein
MSERDKQADERAADEDAQAHDDDAADVPWGEMGRGVPAGLGSGDLGGASDVPDDAVAGEEDAERER